MGNKLGVASGGTQGRDGQDGKDGKDGQGYWESQQQSKDNIPDNYFCYRHRDENPEETAVSCYKKVPAFVTVTNTNDPGTYLPVTTRNQLPDSCYKIIDVQSGDDPQTMWTCTDNPLTISNQMYVIAQDYLQMADAATQQLGNNGQQIGNGQQGGNGQPVNLVGGSFSMWANRARDHRSLVPSTPQTLQTLTNNGSFALNHSYPTNHRRSRSPSPTHWRHWRDLGFGAQSGGW